MSDFLDALPQRYRVIFCDLWGCVHNGVALLSGALERLDCWAAERRTVVFLTNAPRPSSAVVEQLSVLGLPDRLNGSIVSSGDVALALIAQDGRQRSPTFLGSHADARLLEAAGMHFSSEESADTIVCTGFDERGFDVKDYAAQLRYLAERKVEMLCLNPDRVVHRGGTVEPCAGSIADAYQSLGGAVRRFGKPYPDIYEYAIRYANQRAAAMLPRSAIVAIGDSIATDFVGAVNAGLDFVFVAGGIDEASYQTGGGRLFDGAPGLQAESGRPVAVIPGLG